VEKTLRFSSLRSASLSIGLGFSLLKVQIYFADKNGYHLSQSFARASAEIPCKRHWRADARKVSDLHNQCVLILRSQTILAFTRRDLKSYQDSISSFGIPSLHERFEFIRQLGNVFLVRPEILKSYITENYLGRIDSSLLKPYLALRSDWGQFEKGFNDTDIPEDGGSEGRGLKDRFGRLSIMMKELEGLKLGEGISMGIPSIPSSFPGSFSISTRPFGS
jgi:hypothetical protein